ncbi:MAG: phage portal protein [Oscillospiraceae bacterium]|nr:phage portal protein [Oscillospiraceae bacterium]
MKFKDLFSFKKPVATVQTAQAAEHPFRAFMSYTPLMTPDCRLYAAMRESVPLIDAALDKIVRLTGGFNVVAETPARQHLLDAFVRGVKVGPCSTGLYQFMCVYLNSLLTYGNAVGEIVLTSDGSEIAALYNADLSDVQIRRGNTALDVEICTRDGIEFIPVKYPELVLFTPLTPPPGEFLGVSLLRSLPFVTSILLKIFHSTGVNFQRIANLRYAVTYKPGNTGLDKAYAKDIAEAISTEWASAMQSTSSGIIKDFVAVGDVEIKVIGADNQMIETEVPVRQMLEQIIAKLGIPPFMLGLHWSSTERMSSQQADILTSELESYRRTLESIIVKICETHLRLKGFGDSVSVVWDDINLQDEVETANARYIEAQAALLESRAKNGERGEKQ